VSAESGKSVQQEEDQANKKNATITGREAKSPCMFSTNSLAFWVSASTSHIASVAYLKYINGGML
jgi:hypothetical protein